MHPSGKQGSLEERAGGACPTSEAEDAPDSSTSLSDRRLLRGPGLGLGFVLGLGAPQFTFILKKEKKKTNRIN